MKNKILIAIVLVLAFSAVGITHATNQNNDNGAGVQTQQQAQTPNQKANIQIQAQLKVQNQIKDNRPKEVIQKKQQKATNAKKKSQNQQQAQTDNKDDDTQIQKQNENQEKGQGSAMAQKRKSQVAKAVQKMLQIADKNGTIGERIRTIAQAQNENQEKLEARLKKIQNRNNFTKFFIGPNYGEINNAKKELEDNLKQINELEGMKGQLFRQVDQDILMEQIENIKEASLEIETSLDKSKKGFSLFGWAFRFFSRR